MIKKSKKRSHSVFAPGLCLSGQNVDNIATFLQAAALEEETEKGLGQTAEPISEIANSRSILYRQGAVDETDRRTRILPHQSRSDPTCSFRIQNVYAVQESGVDTKDGHRKADEQMRRTSLQAPHIQCSIEESHLENKGLYCDAPNVSADNTNSSELNHYVRSLSDGAAVTLNGKDWTSVSSTTSSYFIGVGISDKFSQQHKDLLSLRQEIMSNNCNSNSLIKLQQELVKNMIRERLERSESSKTVDLQSLLTFFQKKPSECPPGHNAVNKESTSFNKEELFSTLSYVDSQNDPEIQRRLLTSARCFDSVCHKCVEMRQSMKKLQDPNIPAQSLSKEERLLLMNMHIHSLGCDLSRCPFYWCDILETYLSSHEEIVAVMKQRVENFVHDSFLGNAQFGKFIKLHTNYPEYVQEDKDWTSLIRLGHSRNTILALPAKQNHQSGLEYWVIKKVISPPEDDSQKKLYEYLFDMKLSGIVQHFWAASFTEPEMFVVCTKYEGSSLKDVVQNQPIHSLTMLVNLMLKLIEILQHLHQKGILYLNWSSSNILIDQTQTKIKLADFTASTLKVNVEDDIGWLDGYLPLHLHPPELLQSPKSLDEKSDVWGLGCLLHEMVTGKPVWHQYQHETLDGLRQKMREQKQPVIPTDVKELPLIFKSCWEIEPSKRPVLNELNQLLIDRSLERQKQVPSTINVYQLSRA